MNLRESLFHTPSELWISVFTEGLSEIRTWPNWKMLQEKIGFLWDAIFFKMCVRVIRYIVLEFMV
jgi:hypothetical protein